MKSPRGWLKPASKLLSLSIVLPGSALLLCGSIRPGDTFSHAGRKHFSNDLRLLMFRSQVVYLHGRDSRSASERLLQLLHSR